MKGVNAVSKCCDQQQPLLHLWGMLKAALCNNGCNLDVTEHVYIGKEAQQCPGRLWQLQGYANFRGIKIVGDMPIYVGAQSADVWAHQELFELDEAGNALNVAGVPPDAFSETGQLWGNPLYDWPVCSHCCMSIFICCLP